MIGDESSLQALHSHLLLDASADRFEQKAVLLRVDALTGPRKYAQEGDRCGLNEHIEAFLGEIHEEAGCHSDGDRHVEDERLVGLHDGVLRPAELYKVREPHKAEVEAEADDYEAYCVHRCDVLHANDKVQVCNDDERGEGCHRARPQICGIPLVDVQYSRVRECQECYVKDNGRVHESLELSEEKGANVEEETLLTCIVQQRQVFRELTAIEVRVHVPVENAEEDDWQTGEDDVVELDVPLVEHGHRAEAAHIRVKVVWQRQRDVLVEEVEDEAADASISRPTVEENQAPELLELGNGEVRGLHGTQAFISVEAHADVSLIDH